MTSNPFKVIGVITLTFGLVLIVQSVSRLRADPSPAPTICPDEDISTGTKDCAVAAPCSNSNGNINACLGGIKGHWDVMTNFPRTCVGDQTDKLCDERSRQCKTFIRCTYNVISDLCQKDMTQPDPPQTEQELKLLPGPC